MFKYCETPRELIDKLDEIETDGKMTKLFCIALIDGNFVDCSGGVDSVAEVIGMLAIIKDSIMVDVLNGPPADEKGEEKKTKEKPEKKPEKKTKRQPGGSSVDCTKCRHFRSCDGACLDAPGCTFVAIGSDAPRDTCEDCRHDVDGVCKHPMGACRFDRKVTP